MWCVMSYSSLGKLVAAVLPGDASWRMRLMREWPDMVGDLQQHICLKKIYGQCVVVGVYDVHWLHEMHMMAPLLLSLMNEKCGEGAVVSVRFTLVQRREPRDEKKSGVVQEPVEKPAVVQDRMGARHHQALGGVKDEQLKDALQKFFNRCVE